MMDEQERPEANEVEMDEQERREVNEADKLYAQAGELYENTVSASRQAGPHVAKRRPSSDGPPKRRPSSRPTRWPSSSPTP